MLEWCRTVVMLDRSIFVSHQIWLSPLPLDIYCDLQPHLGFVRLEVH